MSKGFCRCGICDLDFQSTEEWDNHAKTWKHKRLVEIGINLYLVEDHTRKELIPLAHDQFEKERRFVFR